ncbi:MAG TPA: SDR family oxidoreductase [Acidimicrobiia bacterium]|nr:SDR family oxidoreductase [Acidimicrobiia bacterium]
MRQLQGKVAVITGAGAGIGRSTAVALAREGVAVAACDLDPAAAGATADAARAAGSPRSSAHQVDVASEEEMRGLVEAVVARHGVVDLVVNNAGIATAFVPSVDLSLDRFHRVMDVNFWGVVHGSLLFLPHLLARPEANLVNVTSNAGLLAYPRLAPYVSSKFAARGFSETLRMELRSTPVRVTVVSPGSTKTRILANSPVIDPGQAEALQATFSRQPGRSPEAVARAVVKAVRQDAPRALVGPDTAVMDLLARLAPGGYSRLLGRVMDAVIEKLAGEASRPAASSGKRTPVG